MELKELSALVDEYYEARNARLSKQRETDNLAEIESDLKRSLIEIMRTQAVSTVGGIQAVVTLRSKPKPIASDWSKVYEFIRDNDAFDLLQKRLNETAVKLRWEDEMQIPGISTFVVDELSISKPR